MALPLSSLLIPLSRNGWVFTALLFPLAFANEQNKGIFNLPPSPSSQKDYCHSISTFCNRQSTERVGWVGPFGFRSSISILYSCLATLFACTWSILQLNLPSKRDSTARKFIRKIKWMIIALLFPEFIAGVALAEFWLALESKKALQKVGAKHWTLTHGYFTNMGGFVLDIPEQDPFPTNSETLKILIEEGLVGIPEITAAEIQDRSKTDSFARTFTILQVSWMVVQCIGRRIQGLYVTPLEFLASFCIAISFFTYVFEWAKPKDVIVPITLNSKKALDNELVERILAIYRRLYGNKELSTTKDVTRIPFGAIMNYLMDDNSNSPRWVRVLQFGISVLAGLYNGLHLWVRRELFTRVPWLLWRYSCVASILIPWVFLFQLFFLSNRLRVILYVLYGVARLLPFVVGLMGFGIFSSVPITAYYDVDWTSFIPHF